MGNPYVLSGLKSFPTNSFSSHPPVLMKTICVLGLQVIPLSTRSFRERVSQQGFLSSSLPLVKRDGNLHIWERTYFSPLHRQPGMTRLVI